MSEFFSILETKINKETISKYQSVILQCGDKSELDTVICKLKDGTTIRLENLSTGEKQILIILLNLLCQNEEDIIILMDEPEISLHLEWQEKFIEIIKKIKPHAQIIIATHSPSIAINWHGQISFMSDIIVHS